MVRELAAVYFAALCGASRPHTEGSSMLQVSDKMKASDRDEYLLSMKQKVLDFAQDGVPDAAKPFLQDIRSLLGDILGELATEKTNQKSAHDGEFAAFDTAWQKYDNTTYNELPVTQAKSAHSECRDDEHDKWNITQVCDDEENTAQGHYNGKESAVRSASERSGVCAPETYEWRTSESLGTYKSHVNSYKVAIEELISSRGTLVAKIADCEDKDGHLSSQKGTCDGKQTDYENAACTYALAYNTAITTYGNEYTSAKNSFETEVPSWEASSENRLHQCQTVNTVICYINALENNDAKADLEAAVGSCDSTAQSLNDCNAYAFTPSDVPAQQATLSIPPVCGEAGFEYFADAAPEGTALAACATCVGLR